MSSFHKRLERLERLFETEPGPALSIMPDTTFAEAKADYEAKTGQHVTDEEFEKILPTCYLVVFTIVTSEGEERNPWVHAIAKKT